MAGKWEISERGAAELDSLSKKLYSSCPDLEAANGKLKRILQENPAIGPHKNDIQECIDTIESISKSAKEGTELLSGRIHSTAVRIRAIVANKRFKMGK